MYQDLGSIIHPVSVCFIVQICIHTKKKECAYKKFPSLLECLGYS